MFRLLLAAAISFAWTPDPGTTNPATNPAGYHLHQGTRSGVYTSSTDQGSATSATVNVPPGTYFGQ